MWLPAGLSSLTRIAIAHGESYVAWTARGACKAVLTGNRLTDWKGAIDRPQVGDWVAGTYSDSLDAFLVAHLLERRTCLIRQASGKRPEPQVIAANVDGELDFTLKELLASSGGQRAARIA